MTSVLAQQLAQLAEARGDGTRRVRGKPSLLFEYQRAADIDVATIYGIALQGGCGRERRPGAALGPVAARRLRARTRAQAPRRARSRPAVARRGARAHRRAAGPTRRRLRPSPAGLEHLCAIDARFQPFSHSLFARSSLAVNRDQITKQDDAKINQQIAAFTRLLSNHFLSPSCFKTLEYLIRRYRCGAGAAGRALPTPRPTAPRACPPRSRRAAPLRRLPSLRALLEAPARGGGAAGARLVLCRPLGLQLRTPAPPRPLRAAPPAAGTPPTSPSARRRVNELNVDDLMAAALPYHSTNEFVRLVQTARLEGTTWSWLAKMQESGAALPRDILVKRCTTDAAVLAFICECAKQQGSARQLSRTWLSFYAVVACELVAAQRALPEDLVAALLPFLTAGLQHDASQDYRAASLMIVTQICSKSALSKDFLSGAPLLAAAVAMMMPDDA
jgi:hypothetical protein